MNKHKLQVRLAQYGALRSEVQFRSDFQNRIFQLHITILPAIIAVALGQPSWGHWLVFAIPAVSLAFGLWWLDNAIRIEQVGKHLRSIEQAVNELLRDPLLMRWEPDPSINQLHIRGEVSYFKYLAFLTFALPAAVALVLMTLLVVAPVGIPDSYPWPVKFVPIGLGLLDCAIFVYYSRAYLVLITGGYFWWTARPKDRAIAHERL